MVGITGANGFIGRHLLRRIPTAYTFTGNLLTDDICSLKDCDLIYHCAFVNRGTNYDIIKNGISTTLRLKENCKGSIVFLSSIRAEENSVYGITKKACELLMDNKKDIIIRLPHIFGYGQDLKNSVVSMFCYNIANKQEPSVTKDKMLNLVYIDEAIDSLLELKAPELTNCVYVSELKEILLRLARERNPQTTFESQLYKTYLQYDLFKHTC